VQVIQACVTNKLFFSSNKSLLAPVKQMWEATQELEGISMAGERTMGKRACFTMLLQLLQPLVFALLFCTVLLTSPPNYIMGSHYHHHLQPALVCPVTPTSCPPKFAQSPFPPLPNNCLWEIKEVTPASVKNG
jgi:hypothetical protein